MCMLCVCVCVCVCMQSHFSCVWSCHSVDHSPQDSLSMGFSRQDYGSGLPFPSPGDLPDPGIKHASLKSLALQTGSFPQVLSAKPLISGYKALYAKFLSLIRCSLKAIVLWLLILCITWYLVFKTFFSSGIPLCFTWGGWNKVDGKCSGSTEIHAYLSIR